VGSSTYLRANPDLACGLKARRHDFQNSVHGGAGGAGGAGSRSNSAQITFAQNTDSTVFVVFGVVCVLLAVLNWFAWPTIRAGWEAERPSGKTGPGLPVSALFFPVLYVGGLLNALSAAGRHRPKPGAPPANGDRRS
jgi:hypothetical protein